MTSITIASTAHGRAGFHAADSAAKLPASGTYVYNVLTADGARLTIKIAIASSYAGVRTRETLSKPPLYTEQVFDRALHETSYRAMPQGINVTFPPTKAACTLVFDHLLTSSVMLPAIQRMTHTDACHFVTFEGAPVEATVGADAAPHRPRGVPAQDRELTLRFSGLAEAVWYDPRTLIADYMDFGNGGKAVRHAANVRVALPAAATPAPLASKFHTRDVTFTSLDGSRLAGTITYPAGDGPHPAVLLVAGSGTTDRNESVGAQHPFFDLSEGLAAHGFVVLRYDKRFAGASTSNTPPLQLTRQTYIDDVRAAFNALAHDPAVDPKRIDLLGHSEGGELVMGAVLEGTPARALVLLAPLSTTYDEAIDDQVARGLLTVQQAGQMEAATGAFFPSWKNVDPRAEIARLTLPLLIVHGTSDENVTSPQIAGLVAAAKAAHRAVTDIEVPGEGHLFVGPAGAFDPEVIDEIAAWMAR